MMNWFESLLPALYCKIRRESEFKKDEFAIGLQNARNPLKGIHNAWNRAQRKRANNRVNAIVLQWDTFPWQIKKFDIQLRSTRLFFCESNHPRVGFKRTKFTHSCGIIISEIRAGTRTDFKNYASG